MAVPILWTPGKKRPFCKKNHVHKIPPFRGGVFWVLEGGGSADFIFMGARIFLIIVLPLELSPPAACLGNPRRPGEKKKSTPSFSRLGLPPPPAPEQKAIQNI